LLFLRDTIFAGALSPSFFARRVSCESFSAKSLARTRSMKTMKTMKNKRADEPENEAALFFERLANHVTRLTGTSMAFVLASSVIIVWLATGPVFGYSNTWQLVINTGTTIITFLMVFLIQKSQNKDGRAMQLKLNELIAASKEASNRLVDVESLTEHELLTLSEYYATLAKESAKSLNIHESHSVEEAIGDALKKVTLKKESKAKKQP